MKHWPLLLVACLLLAGLANASQVTHISASKVRSSDFSSDGNVTFNSTSPTGMTVNNSGYCLGHWASSLRGCVVNTTLTAWRNWTLPDADGTFLLGPAPSFSDYSNANHDHLDADDGGTLSLGAGVITSGTMARGRLPAELAYEDEANTFAVRVTLSDGTTADGWLYVSAPNLLQANGTFVAKTNSYLEGAIRGNASLLLPNTAAGTLVVGNDTRSSSTSTALVELSGTLPLNIVRYGSASGPQIFGESARGTATVPTALQSADQFFAFVAGGYNGESWSNQNAKIAFTTTETWTTGVQGSQIAFELTPTGSTTRTPILTLTGSLGSFAAPLYTSGAIEIDGALNHDGATAGFFGVAPVAQVACVAAATGGAVIDSQARAAANGALAALKSLGLMASGC